MAGRRWDDQFTMHDCKCPWHYDQTSVHSPRKFRDVALNLSNIAQSEWSQVNCQEWCHRLDCSKLSGSASCTGVSKDRRAGYVRHYLFDELQPFSTHAVFEICESGHVAARPS